MKYLILITLFISDLAASASATKQTITGDWISNDGYGRLKGRNSSELLVTKDKITYTIDGLSLDCPVEHFKLIDEVFHIRCFSEEYELVHLVLSAHGSGKYAAAFGFEYWKGGMPDKPEAIYGGVPVSFEIRNK